MMTARELHAWCQIPYQELTTHPQRKIPFRLVADSEAMGQLMARELVESDPAAEHRRPVHAGDYPLRAGLLVPALYRPGQPRTGQLARPGGVSHGRVPGLAGARAAARPPVQLPRLHGAPFLRPGGRRRWLCPKPTASGSTARTWTEVAGAIVGRADRHHLWRLGPGRPHRL